MPGLRITFDRQWPAIFEEHPWPWRMDTATEKNGPTVIDAAGQIVCAGDVHTTYILYDLYEYTMYSLYDYMLGTDFRHPSVIYRHPLPWWHRHLEYEGGPSEEEHTVFDANNEQVFDCMGDDPDILVYAAMFDLANFVDCRLRTTAGRAEQ